MKKNTKKSTALILILSIIFLFNLPIAAYAVEKNGSNNGKGNNNNNSIIKSVKDSSKITTETSQISEDLDKAAKNMIELIKQIAIIGAVIMVIWIGITLVGGGVKNISNCKVQAILLLVSLILIFKAESIVAAIYGIVT